MQFEIVPYNEIVESDWDAFVDRCKSGWLWHISSFIKAKSSWKNHTNKSFAIVDSDRKIFGILPLFLIQSKAFRILPIYTLDNIGGWLIDPNIKSYSEVEKMILEHSKNIAKKHSAHELRINFASTSLYHNTDPLFANGEKGESAYLSVIDLNKDQNELWLQMRKGLRSEIKKAEKLNITFREATPADLNSYYDMHIDVCSKSALSPHSKEYFKTIFNEILENKNSYIGCALQDGKVLAMVLVLKKHIKQELTIFYIGSC